MLCGQGLQALSEGIALVAGKAIGGFRKDLIDPASIERSEQGGKAWTLSVFDAGGAAYGAVVECRDDFPPFIVGTLATGGDLILDRAGVLELAGIAGVDQRAHGMGPYRAEVRGRTLPPPSVRFVFRAVAMSLAAWARASALAKSSTFGGEGECIRRVPAWHRPRLGAR